MLRSLSTRAIAVVAVLLAAAVVAVLIVVAGPKASARTVPPLPGPSHGLVLDVDGAVRRTLSERFARLRLDLARSGGPHVTIAGVVGLASDDADLALDVEGRDGGPGRVRIVGDRAWIGSDDLPWMPMPAAGVGQSSATSWRAMLRQLHADPKAPEGVSLAGHAATVELDGQGRIHRVRAVLPRSTFDLRLDGYDEDLAIVPPP